MPRHAKLRALLMFSGNLLILPNSKTLGSLSLIRECVVRLAIAAAARLSWPRPAPKSDVIVMRHRSIHDFSCQNVLSRLRYSLVFDRPNPKQYDRVVDACCGPRKNGLVLSVLKSSTAGRPADQKSYYSLSSPFSFGIESVECIFVGCTMLAGDSGPDDGTMRRVALLQHPV
jgi:hypothetical protein